MEIDPLVWYRYTIWANEQVIAGARQLSLEQLNAPIRPGYLSTLGVLVHILAAERNWLLRCQGQSPDTLLSTDDLPTLDALLEAWPLLQAEMLNFLAGAGPAQQEVSYRTTKGVEYHNTLWQVVAHVMNHGTEHRSQVALYLAMQGIDVGGLDFIRYLREGQ